LLQTLAVLCFSPFLLPLPILPCSARIKRGFGGGRKTPETSRKANTKQSKKQPKTSPKIET